MAIKFKCPHCQTGLEAASEFAGKQSQCPQCKKELTIPEKDEETSTAKEKPAKKD